MTHRAITMEHPAVPLDSFRPSNNYPIAAQRKSARHNQGMRNAKLHGIPARKEDDQNWIESRPTAVSHLLGSLVALMFCCKNDSFVADCMHRFWPCRCHQVVGWLDLAQKYQERNRNRTWMNLISDLIKKHKKNVESVCSHRQGTWQGQTLWLPEGQDLELQLWKGSKPYCRISEKAVFTTS